MRIKHYEKRINFAANTVRIVAAEIERDKKLSERMKKILLRKLDEEINDWNKAI